MNSGTETLGNVVYQAHIASVQLAKTKVKIRDRVILEIAEGVKQQRDQILEANTLDLEASRDMAIPELVLEWLKLTPERVQSAIDCLIQLASLNDPLANPLTYDGVKRIPLGTVAFVYEAFPQLALIATAMCLKAGNSLILKGGNEGSHTQTVIANIIKEAIASREIPQATVAVAPEGSSVKELVTLERYLRLVIPYGRPSFVQQISKQATVSALPTSMGNCHLYLSTSASLEEAQRLVSQSRSSDPDPVNAIEKVIIHRNWLQQGLIQLVQGWQKQGIAVRGCSATVNYCNNFAGGDQLSQPITEETQWNLAYLDDTIAIKVVDSLTEAITWTNLNGSGHADCILTDSLKESDQFAEQVRSSMIFVNASNRFTRNGMIGANGNRTVVLGMTSLKTRGASRNPGMIDLNALTTTKRVIVGS
jgi:glutamate-5-semialdehyde dehydrogenase